MLSITRISLQLYVTLCISPPIPPYDKVIILPFPRPKTLRVTRGCVLMDYEMIPLNTEPPHLPLDLYSANKCTNIYHNIITIFVIAKGSNMSVFSFVDRGMNMSLLKN